ncbi:hypothetical protein [Streptomyces sp. NPDC004728]|uniref:hypothetical protein n=1 Tax=Streptomyces sp. NPDC004728 TaxID=3154289 RepID=UPI0033B6675E
MEQQDTTFTDALGATHHLVHGGSKEPDTNNDDHGVARLHFRDGVLVNEVTGTLQRTYLRLGGDLLG